jgi:hypothetical protein
MSVGTGRQSIIILFWKQQFHFLEYINGNKTFILDFHWPFICSVQYKEIQVGEVAKLCMRKGFQIHEEMRKYLVIYEEDAPFWIPYT